MEMSLIKNFNYLGKTCVDQIALIYKKGVELFCRHQWSTFETARLWHFQPSRWADEEIKLTCVQDGVSFTQMFYGKLCRMSALTENNTCGVFVHELHAKQFTSYDAVVNWADDQDGSILLRWKLREFVEPETKRVRREIAYVYPFCQVLDGVGSEFADCDSTNSSVYDYEELDTSCEESHDDTV